MRFAPRRIGVLVALLACFSGPRVGAADEPNPAGTWTGALQVGALKLRLVLHVRTDSTGKLVATLDSPDQGAKGIPLDHVSLEGRTLRIRAANIGAGYDGEFSADGARIEGSWSQGGNSLPLVLERGEAPILRRPQTPQPPFPYRSEDVNIESVPGVALAGTLTMPPAGGPFAAVLLLSGSGPQDRDETLFEHRPFAVIADHLTRNGIAVLRLDDRGVGGSTGSFATATSEDFGRDAEAAVAWLSKRPEIQRRRIGILGHSEGGLIGPMVASRSKDLAFLILLAGPGVRGDLILFEQGEKIARAAGQDSVAIARQRLAQETLFAIVQREPDVEAARRQLEESWRTLRASLPAAEQGKSEYSNEAAGQQFETLLSPWFRMFLTYDPRPALQRVRCPVLALFGAKDLQVVPGQNAPAIEQALREGRNRDVTVRTLPNLNHLFQTCTTGGVDEYATIEETIAPAVLDTITTWIAARTSGRP